MARKGKEIISNALYERQIKIGDFFNGVKIGKGSTEWISFDTHRSCWKKNLRIKYVLI